MSSPSNMQGVLPPHQRKERQGGTGSHTVQKLRVQTATHRSSTAPPPAHALPDLLAQGARASRGRNTQPLQAKRRSRFYFSRSRMFSTIRAFVELSNWYVC